MLQKKHEVNNTVGERAAVSFFYNLSNLKEEVSIMAIEICAANGRDLYRLNLSAPRLMREISGDFAVEVCVSSVSDEKPQRGG